MTPLVKPSSKAFLKPHLISFFLHQEIKAKMDDPLRPSSSTNAALHAKLKKFYYINGYQLAWSEPALIDSFARALQAAPDMGLDTKEYDWSKISELQSVRTDPDRNRQDKQKLAKLDVMLTSMYLDFATDIAMGRVDPTELDTTWYLKEPECCFAEHLRKAIKNKTIYSSLMSLAPEDDQYKRLKWALEKYRELARKDEWTATYLDQTLARGERHVAIPRIRQRLALSEDLHLHETIRDPMLYDGLLEGGVKSFQKRNGLKPDGVLGPSTMSAMNVPIESRILQIELNMERLRWLPKMPPDKFIQVNIPEYSLRLFDDRKLVEKMKVIVGEAYESRTPVFKDRMEYIVFSPTWTVPLDIVREEIIPNVKNNPDYLQQNNYVIYNSWQANAMPLPVDRLNWQMIDPKEFHYKVVQKSGGFNSLGRVKFIFPNDMSIYLHDTPSDYLFNRKERDLSHGCIRIEKPVRLVESILHDQNWDREKIIEFMYKDEPITVNLLKPIPVHIVYMTAWVDQENQINFRQDIYGHDKKQIKAIERNQYVLY
jgi:murein L,D-transpeptidase YcbB/YkuD